MLGEAEGLKGRGRVETLGNGCFHCLLKQRQAEQRCRVKQRLELVLARELALAQVHELQCGGECARSNLLELDRAGALLHRGGHEGTQIWRFGREDDAVGTEAPTFYLDLHVTQGLAPPHLREGFTEAVGGGVGGLHGQSFWRTGRGRPRSRGALPLLGGHRRVPSALPACTRPPCLPAPSLPAREDLRLTEQGRHFSGRQARPTKSK